MKFKFLILLSFIFIGCSDDDIIPIEVTENKKLVDIGAYTLLEESLSKIPYKINQSAIFVDSTGLEIRFEITSQDTYISRFNRLYKYDVHVEGDTVMYMYSSETKRSNIVNKERNIKFNISLSADPWYSDPESRKVADIYEVFCVYPNDISTSVQVVYDVVNQRTWPFISPAKNLGDVTIHGKLFNDVRIKEFSYPKSIVLFNYDLGIVSFTDEKNVVWRFERFE